MPLDPVRYFLSFIAALLTAPAAAATPSSPEGALEAYVDGL